MTDTADTFFTLLTVFANAAFVGLFVVGIAALVAPAGRDLAVRVVTAATRNASGRADGPIAATTREPNARPDDETSAARQTTTSRTNAAFATRVRSVKKVSAVSVTGSGRAARYLIGMEPVARTSSVWLTSAPTSNCQSPAIGMSAPGAT